MGYVNADGYLDLVVGVNDDSLGDEIVLYGSPNGLAAKPPLLLNPGKPPVLQQVTPIVNPPAPFPNAPTFTAPGNGTTITDATPTIRWTEIAGAVQYELNVYNKPAGFRLYNQFVATPAFTPPVDLPKNTTIQCFVRAIDANGNPGLFSSALEFVVTDAGLTPNTPSTPFEWAPTLGASSYDVLAYDLAAGQQALSMQGVGDTSLELSTLFARAGTYQVFVRPSGGTWTAPQIVEVHAVAPLPGQTTPAVQNLELSPSHANSADVLVTWQIDDLAARYELIGYDVAAGKQIVGLDDALGGYLRVPDLSPGRTYQFYVRAYNAVGEAGGWSTAKITVEDATAPPAPMLTGPASPTASINPKITWTAVDQAVQYSLIVYDLSKGTSTFATSTDVTEHQPFSALTVGGRYQAFVKAYNAAGIGSEWSDPLEFVVGGTLFPAAPKLNPPAAINFDQTPTISWSPIIGAAGYEVELYDRANGSLVFARQTVTGTSFTPPQNLANGDYQVFVRAKDFNGATGFWSDPAEFSVVVQEILPVEPALGSIAQPIDAVFISLTQF